MRGCWGWIGAGVRPACRPTFFASPKKVGKERRPRDARLSAACGAGGALCFSKTGAAMELASAAPLLKQPWRTAPRFSAMLGALYGGVKRLGATTWALNLVCFEFWH